jgi:hypothetical protein
VTNTPGAVTDATADIALALILMTARRAGEGERMLRAGGWTGWHPTQLLGLHVGGKTVGIIGMGRIGKAIARRCVRAWGWRRCSSTARPWPMTPAFPPGRWPLAEALAADVVVVAVPGNTRNAASDRRRRAGANETGGDLREHRAGRCGGRGGAGRRAAKAGSPAPALMSTRRSPRSTRAFWRWRTSRCCRILAPPALEVRTAMGLMAVGNLIAFAEDRPLPNAVN